MQADHQEMINAANVRLFKLLTLTRPHENTHLFTLSNTTQSPFQVTMTLWYERQKWVRLWKCKWEGGALQWIDTDCRILQNSRVKHNIVKPSSLQRFAHQRSKGAFQAAACVQPSGGEKKENFSPQCPATVNQMHSWDIKNTPPHSFLSIEGTW